MRIAWLMPEYGELFGLRAEESKPAIGSYPDVFQMVFIDRVDTVAGQALRIVGIITERMAGFIFQVYDAHPALRMSDVKKTFPIVEGTPV